MDLLAAPGYSLARLLVQRGLALVYLVAFISAVNQFRPLLGERGLLPVPRFVSRVSFRQSPSLFHWRYSDRLLLVVAWSGAALAALALLGVSEAGPAWVSMAVWLALYLLYLSIVNVGQTFYAFGWESILCEAGFFAVFLGPADRAPSLLAILLLRWLLFRIEFGAGLIKLRGDRCWRDLTCLEYHHETQPLPNPLSWWFHHLPRPLHKAEVLGNHVAQLVAPFGLFLPQPIAGVAGLLMIVTQGYLIMSGNFAWLNAITIVLAFAAIPDSWWGLILPDSAVADPSLWFHRVVIVVTLATVALSWWPVRNLLSRRQLMNFSFNPFHLVGTYGAFGSVTRERYELIVEGSADGETWEPYGFRAKPGDPLRRPPQVAPYHLRLDWLMWFIPLSPGTHRHWFLPFVQRLLEGDARTLALLLDNPFPDRPPAQIRARFWRYRFTSPGRHRETGAWWERSYEGEYLPAVRLDEQGRLTTVREAGWPSDMR